jgi:hypothetical protein
MARTKPSPRSRQLATWQRFQVSRDVDWAQQKTDLTTALQPVLKEVPGCTAVHLGRLTTDPDHCAFIICMTCPCPVRVRLLMLVAISLGVRGDNGCILCLKCLRRP